MLAVVYHYAEVSEKWKNIHFVSHKELTEAQNRLNEALSIVKKRRQENKRKMQDKKNLK